MQNKCRGVVHYYIVDFKKVLFYDCGMGIKISKHPDLAPYIDHTNLNTKATPENIKKLCEEAKKYGFATVCVRPEFVKLSKNELRSGKVKICSVIGFPREFVRPESCNFGSMLTSEKVKEAADAIANGADELDMVINLDALKSGNLNKVKNDISAVKKAAGNKTLKVIIEVQVLSQEQKITACKLCMEANADFVKTSTGYVKDENGKTLGATLEDVKLMRAQVDERLGVKAAGGIKDFETAKRMIEAGANRLGCSASVEIVKG